MQDSVTVHVKAAPEEVWDLVSDVTRIGELSPETFEARWTRGATGPVVGAFFKGHVNRNGRGVRYWTLCRVTDCERGRVFAFDVLAGERVVNSWRYEMVPAGDGTDVTESFRLASDLPLRLYWLLLGRLRGRTNRRGMQQTLERVKAIVER